MCCESSLVCEANHPCITGLAPPARSARRRSHDHAKPEPCCAEFLVPTRKLRSSSGLESKGHSQSRKSAIPMLSAHESVVMKCAMWVGVAADNLCTVARFKYGERDDRVTTTWEMKSKLMTSPWFHSSTKLLCCALAQLGSDGTTETRILTSHLVHWEKHIVQMQSPHTRNPCTNSLVATRRSRRPISHYPFHLALSISSAPSAHPYS